MVWICRRCGSLHSKHVLRCDCEPGAAPVTTHVVVQPAPLKRKAVVTPPRLEGRVLEVA
jgi:hypothetical protein